MHYIIISLLLVLDIAIEILQVGRIVPTKIVLNCIIRPDRANYGPVSDTTVENLSRTYDVWVF